METDLVCDEMAEVGGKQGIGIYAMNDKIRVLTMISGLAIGEPLGGAERFGLELARSLDQEKFEPVVCAFWRRSAPSEQYWVDYLNDMGIEVLFAADRGRGFTPLKYWKGLVNVASCFQGRPVDVIHSHFQLGSVTALLLRRALNARALVRTAHGSVQWEWNNTFSGFLCRQIFTRWIFPVVFDAEVGVSQAAVSSLDRRPCARITGKKAVLFHNGISLDRFIGVNKHPEKRQEIGLSADDLVVGSVGRLSEQKGYTYLIAAAPTIVAKLPNVRFVIIGDGELRESLRLQAEQSGLSEIFIFAGPRQDVESLLATMDLFVLPSLWEGLPTVVLESMASGVPVVATDIPGTTELIQPGRTGWLAQPRDPTSLAACILEALCDPAQRTAIARTALEDVVPRFSIQYIAHQYERLYDELIRPSV